MAQGFASRAVDLAPGWQDYTPTYANVTVGNGTVTARYTQVGTTVHVYFELEFGSTSSISGDVQVGLPVEAADHHDNANSKFGLATFLDNGGSRYAGWGSYVAAAQTALLRVGNAASTYLVETALSATVPFTWTTSDKLIFEATYEATSTTELVLGTNNDHGGLSGLSDFDHVGQTVLLAAPVTILSSNTGSTVSYTNLDCSANVPTGSTGIIFGLYFKASVAHTTNRMKIRENGVTSGGAHTDGAVLSNYADSGSTNWRYTSQIVPCDSSSVVEYAVDHGSGTLTYILDIIGYIT